MSPHVSWATWGSTTCTPSTFPSTYDSDGEGIPNTEDNCPDVFNPDQADGDGTGDAYDEVSDSRTAAVELCSGTVMGTTVAATHDGSSGCNDFPNLNKDVRYACAPTTDGTLTIDTCAPGLSTIVSVNTGCPGTIENEVVCDGTTCSGTWGVVSFNATAGRTHLFSLTGWFFSEGDCTLALARPARANPPAGADLSISGDVDCEDFVMFQLVVPGDGG